jgi:hypothetical protein
MSKTEKTMDLRKWRDLDLDEVTVRKTNSKDTMDAAARCVPVDGTGIDAQLFMVLLRQEQLFGAIRTYKLRGVSELKTVPGTSCVEAQLWGNRTREFVGEIYDFVNSMGMEERTDFRKELATGLTPGSTTPSPT